MMSGRNVDFLTINAARKFVVFWAEMTLLVFFCDSGRLGS